MMNPRQHKWKPIHRPASVAMKWSFDKANYDKLIAGVVAPSMDSRWDIVFDGNAMHFYRSWTGYQVYCFNLKNEDNSYVVDSFDVEQDSSIYMRADDEREIESLLLILEHVVGVKPNEL